jgi:hypothetical protein
MGWGCALIDGPDQLALKHAQNGFEVMTTFEDLTIHPNYRVKALLVSKLGPFFYRVKRMLGRATKDRKDRHVLEV